MKFCVLVSFALGADFCQMVAENHGHEWELILDSGAFTNWSTGRQVVTLSSYTDFLREHGSGFAHYLNLDVIGDGKASDDNMRALRGMGFTPTPVFQRGSSVAELDEMLDSSPLVCIGGISRNPNAAAERRYLDQVMRVVGDRHVHLLGVSGQRSLLRARPWSADSSSYVGAKAFGSLRLWISGSSKWVSFPTRKKMKPDPNRTRALAAYGLKWADLMDPEQWKPQGRVNLASVRAWVRYARWLRRLGIRLFLADSKMFDNHENIVDAWEAEKQSWT